MSDKEFLDCRDKFFRWARSNWSFFDENDVEEVFLDAVSIYIEKDRQHKVNTDSYKYIIGVGYRKFHKLYEAKRKVVELKFDPPIDEDSYFRLKELLRKNLNKINEKCRALLIAKYFYRHSAKELMEEFGAASVGVIRQQQKRCRDRLRDFFKNEELEELGFL
ncbi:MAG: hypothetical protein AAF849_12785 [Bacteroidota bacterium]